MRKLLAFLLFTTPIYAGNALAPCMVGIVPEEYTMSILDPFCDKCDVNVTDHSVEDTGDDGAFVSIDTKTRPLGGYVTSKGNCYFFLSEDNCCPIQRCSSTFLYSYFKPSNNWTGNLIIELQDANCTGTLGTLETTVIPLTESDENDVERTISTTCGGWVDITVELIPPVGSGLEGASVTYSYDCEMCPSPQ